MDPAQSLTAILSSGQASLVTNKAFLEGWQLIITFVDDSAVLINNSGCTSGRYDYKIDAFSPNIIKYEGALQEILDPETLEIKLEFKKSIELEKTKKELEALKKAAELAVSIININLYHQREKVQDAITILNTALISENL